MEKINKTNADTAEKTFVGKYANVITGKSFKLFFGEEGTRELLKQFLEAIIPERKIVGLEFIPQEFMSPLLGKPDIRIDVIVTDTSGASFLVEMLVEEQASLYERVVYYSTLGIKGQLIEERWDDYSFSDVYFIFVLNTSMHKDSDKVLFQYRFTRDCSDEVLPNSPQYLFLELPNFKDVVTEETPLLEKICYALTNMESLNERPEVLHEEFFELLFNSVDKSKFSLNKQRKYIAALMADRDLQVIKAYERKKGREEGRTEGKTEIAKELRNLGVSSDIIAKATGL